MIQRLLKLSLAHRWFVLLAAAALLLVGVYRALNMPVDVFPDLTAPRVTVVTESSGMAAEEVETLVTFPVETAVNGAAGVRRVRSASAPGISVVWVEFDWQTDSALARQRVTERLGKIAAELPPAASTPLLAPASSVMGEIAFVAISSESLSPLALRRIADRDVQRRLLAVEGVSQVVPIGGQVQEYQVLLDPHRAESYGLTLGQVAEALEHGSQNAPGGYVVDGGQESVVRVLGRAHGVDDLKQLVVTTRAGVPVRISDVANVRIGPSVARGTASYNAAPAVLLSIVKQPDADTRSTTRRVDAALDVLQQDLSARKVKLHRDIFRQQDFIDTALENLVTVLRDGAVLVVIVLFLFLWSLKPTLISALAIPLSVVTAVLVLDWFGFSIDTMTLGGLAIAIGELVDDAIVDVENVVRRLREREAQPESERNSVISTIYRASLEVRSAIVSATAVLLLVFMPLLLLEGLEGRLLRPLAVAYVVAISASLVVAVTVTPVLCSFLLPNTVKSHKDPPLLRWLGRAYEPVLRFSLKNPFAVAMVAVIFVAVNVGTLTRLGRSFLPEFNEGSLTIAMVLAPGTSLAESDALASMAERSLLADPAVLSVGRRTGRAEQDEHVLGVETSELEVRINHTDTRSKEQTFSDIRERLQAVPGAQFTLGQPISHRIEHMISGQRAQLSIKVFGDSLAQLRRVAAQVKELVEPIEGLVDLSVEQVVDIPQLVVKVKAQAAQNYGFSTGAAAQAIGTALWGARPTRIYEESISTDVVLKYAPETLSSLDSVNKTRIPTPSGALVPISALADVRRSSGPNYVLRENVQRRLVVTANVAGRDVRSVYEDVQKTVDTNVKRPEGVRIAYAGQFEREEASGKRLLLFGSLALLGIALVVGTTLRSVRQTIIVLVNLPLALAGGVVGVLLAGGVLSVATTIGFITLFGIATRNGILLATRTRDLALAGHDPASAAAGAARERLAPILMTAVTAALGLLPLGLALGQPGSEIQAPMALVILTGLIGSTTLNMLVVPTLLARFGGSPAPATTTEL